MNKHERQILTNLCRIEIRRWQAVPDKQYLVDLLELALAALTAEPAQSEIVGWVREEDGDARDPLFLCGSVKPDSGRVYNSTYYPVKRAAAPVITDSEASKA